jgi:hypothetical protein
MATFEVQRCEKRLGYLRGESWLDLREKLTENWGTRGGFNLSSKTNGPGPFTFNYWPGSENAVIELEEDIPAEPGSHVAAEHSRGAKVEVAKLPYLNRTAIRQRPTFLIFDATGHVFLTIYFGERSDNKGNILDPELHILNPWNLTTENKTLLNDVYTLLDLKLKYKARKIAVTDIVNQLKESRYNKGKSINLQEYEKEGFCTLWVGKIANQVISLLKERKLNTPITPNEYWNQVYKPLLDEIEQAQKEMKSQAPGQNLETVASANVATTGFIGGRKRKHLAKTKRKRVKWTRRTLRARRLTSKI